MEDWKKVLEAIDAATDFTGDFEPIKKREIKLARRYVLEIIDDPNALESSKTCQVVGLLNESADQMEACDFEFLADELRCAAALANKLGFSKSGPRLVG